MIPTHRMIEFIFAVLIQLPSMYLATSLTLIEVLIAVKNTMRR
jgi:hypothetical protein